MNTSPNLRIVAAPSEQAPTPAPIPDGVPRWVVQRYPDVGSDTIDLKAFDGDGYPIALVRCKITGSVEMYERALAIDIESARRKAESRPPLLAGPVLRLLP